MFKTIFFNPLYNALVFLSAVIPGHSIGLAIIALTLIIKILLLPLYHRLWQTQNILKTIEPELKLIKEKYASSKEEQARQTMALYKKHHLNPLSGLVIMLIQLPILLALFYVFRDSFNFHPDLLYSFVTAPETLNTKLFGMFELTSRNYFLSVLTGLTQFIQMKLALPPMPPRVPGAIATTKDPLTDFKTMMNWQMRYFMPVLIVFISLGLPGAVTLYWVTSNLFSIGHELWKKSRPPLALKAVDEREG